MSIEIRAAFVALLFFFMGVWALLRPRDVPKFFDMEAGNPSARNEIRAVYGGFGVAMGAILGWAALGTSPPGVAQGVIWTVAAALAGMAAGRLIAILVERPTKWPLFFGALETTGALLLTL